MQSQYWSIDRLPGLMLPEQKLLQSEGIANTAELLKRTRSPQSKQDLASKLKLNQKYVNKWVALADLARVPSVGDRYCGLLLHSGVASVSQLSQTPCDRLYRQIVRLQVATLHSKDSSPSVELVNRWVTEAKILLMNRD